MAQTETPAFDQKLYAMAQEVHAVWLDMADLPLTNDQLRPYTQRLCDLGNRLMTHAVARLEIERLRQREAALRRAIAHEHQRSNGSSVYMQGPPQHERSRLTCKHPLCAALAQADAQQPVDDSAPAS